MHELELSLISFAGSDSTLTWQGVDKRKRGSQEGWGEGQLLKGGDYFKFFRLRGRLIEGQLLFEEIDSRSTFRLNYEYLKEYEIE